jgi:hypothetical protein
MSVFKLASIRDLLGDSYQILRWKFPLNLIRMFQNLLELDKITHVLHEDSHTFLRNLGRSSLNIYHSEKILRTKVDGRNKAHKVAYLDLWLPDLRISGLIIIHQLNNNYILRSEFLDLPALNLNFEPWAAPSKFCRIQWPLFWLPLPSRVRPNISQSENPSIWIRRDTGGVQFY